MQKPLFKRIADSVNRTFHGDDDVPPMMDPIQELVQSQTVYGVRPVVLHAKLFYYYLVDPGAQNNVNTFRDEITAGGFYLTSEDDIALNKLRTFLRLQKFKQMLKTGVNDALVTGNMMIERLFPKNAVLTRNPQLRGLDLVDQRLVRYVKPKPDDIRYPYQVIQVLSDGTEVAIDYNKLLHYKMFEISRNFLGIGVFHSLAVPQYMQDSELRSILDDMQSMRESFPRIIKRHAKPYRMVIMENESEAYIKKRANDMKMMKDGDWMFTNKDFGYKELTVDPRTRYESLIEYMQIVYETGMQSPASKLQTTPGFTEASATQAREMLDRKVKGMQEDIKDSIEMDIIHPYYLGEKIDPEKAVTEWNFGIPEVPELQITDLIAAATTISPQTKLPLITWNEFRKMTRNGASWELDPDETAVKAMNESRTPEQELPEVDKLREGIKGSRRWDSRKTLLEKEQTVHVDRRFGDLYCFRL